MESNKLEDAKQVFRRLHYGERLNNMDADGVQEVFNAFSAWQSHLLINAVNRAMQQGPVADALEEDPIALRLAVFQQSIGRLYPEKPIEHDEESWLEDVYEPLTSNLLAKMESYIVKIDAPTYKEKYEFLNKVDFNACMHVVKNDLADVMNYMDNQLELNSSADCGMGM